MVVFLIACSFASSILAAVVLGRWLRGDPVDNRMLGLLALSLVLMLIAAAG